MMYQVYQDLQDVFPVSADLKPNFESRKSIVCYVYARPKICVFRLDLN